MEGKIKTVYTEKGFGFIRSKAGVDYFFHRSAVKNANFDELEPGQEVSFEDEEGTKGPRAADVYVESL